MFSVVLQLPADITMARTNHSVFDRSLAIHESGDAEAEDKNALCLELVG